MSPTSLPQSDSTPHRQDPVVPLACPHCLGALQRTESLLSCEECDASFGIHEGIPVLRQHADTYYCEFPREDVHRLLDHAGTDLDDAVRRFLRDKEAPARLGEYMLGCGRAGWQYLLPIDGDSKVLDLGCGWGTIAWSLARFCKHVVACDSTVERMQLLRLRAERDQIENLQLVCAGDCRHLPFPDGAFDAVVVNGVLEWVPSGLPGNPREVQLNFLREIRRVLAPGGCLYLGIENRYAWKTWAMNADGHTGLRFVPWLPRPLADLYSRLWGRGSYRNYLYGPRQYRRLLKSCGLSDVTFHVPCPGYHHPTRMVEFRDTPQLEEAFTRRETSRFRRARQRVRGYLSARFPDAFGMVASSSRRRSFLENLVSRIRGIEAGGDNSGTGEFTYRVNGEMGVVTVIVRAQEAPVVLKLPLHERGLAELRRERQILEEVTQPGHPLASQSALFAKVVAHGVEGRQEYFAFSVLPGESGDRIPVTSPVFDEAVENAADFLVTLHRDSPGRILTVSDLVEPLREAVLTLAADARQRDTANRVADGVLAVFGDRSEQVVWSHGDAKLANFMFDPRTGRLTGVIDWGNGLHPELPGYDLSFLLVSSEAIRNKASIACELRNHHRDGVPNRLAELVARQLESTGLTRPQTYQHIVSYQWMKRLAPLAGKYEARRFDYRHIDAMFDAMS